MRASASESGPTDSVGRPEEAQIEQERVPTLARNVITDNMQNRLCCCRHPIGLHVLRQPLEEHHNPLIFIYGKLEYTKKITPMFVALENGEKTDVATDAVQLYRVVANDESPPLSASSALH
jgi:hypothetical protein